MAVLLPKVDFILSVACVKFLVVPQALAKLEHVVTILFTKWDACLIKAIVLPLVKLLGLGVEV